MLSAAFSNSSGHTPAEGVRPGAPSVSVIIPVRNGGEAFHRCLRRLRSSVASTDEVIVVFDGEPARLPSGSETGVAAISLPTRRGPAVARNTGASHARGEILVFLDADVEVHPQTIPLLRQTFRDDPTIDAVIGSYDDAPASPSAVSQYRNLLHHYTHQHSSYEAKTFWAACGAIRRGVFRAIGGFDERFSEPSVEDIELGYRLVKRDHRIVLRKDILVKHLKQWSLYDVVKTDIFRRAAPWTRLLLEHRTLTPDLNLRWEHRFSTLAAFALLATGLTGLWLPNLLLGIPLFAAILFALNRPFYQLIYRKLGLRGLPPAMLSHWLFYLCAGTGAFVGLLQFMGLFRSGRGWSRTAAAVRSISQ